MSTSEEAYPDHEKTTTKQAEDLKQIPEPGSKTRKGLRAKLEEGQHVIRTDGEIANSGTDGESIKQITLAPEDAKVYGTTPSEYKLWVDYIFDLFGATLEKRFRRYLVALVFGILFWGVGLILALLIGFAHGYLTTPGLYIFAFGVAWVTNCLRWLSQVYHPATNAVRPCFPIVDASYKSTVSPFAKNAVRNKRIFIGGTLFAIPILIYFGAIMLGW
jgi:hypothetical protein